MSNSPIHAVTGAFGYSGRYIASRLLKQGKKVVTLTNSLHRVNLFGDRICAFPLCFDEPEKLAQSLAGVDVLYNTFWVRFNHKEFNHADAVQNTLVLFEAARKAGVRRIVHVSITNPSEQSQLEYFSGKARLERALQESGIGHAILRPTVLFGREDILINNIAWALRKFPVFPVFGDGGYRLQPIYVEDLAILAVAEGEQNENHVVNAIGPETFTYRQLVEAVGQAIGRSRPIVSVPPALGYAAGMLIGLFMRDTFITREEIRGLMDGLLCVDTPPPGTTKLTSWMVANAETLGQNYASELARRRDRKTAYIPGDRAPS
ncbi:MAG TPA: NAD-dependent epimerase/dehydratase family protein [Candidatus Paceibacterota bacterium]|nr:NAD-dependent epimerase/dehydratase family protein [Candidatus Paceibacterota bacterium]